MAGARKHGAHRYAVTTAATAAGTAANPAIWGYDAFANQQGGTTANPTTGFDQTSEQITEMYLILGTTLTGQITNFTTFRVTQYSSAGAVRNQMTVAYSAAGVTSTAFVPINLAGANAAVVPGAGTGTLSVGTGAALPWTLNTGDSVALDTTVTGTGQYVGAVSLNFVTQQKGA